MTEHDDMAAHVGRLPDRHLAALRAALAGFGDTDIAALLAIPVESVPTTLRLAAAKLMTALSERPLSPRRRAGTTPSAAPKDRTMS
jgi:DNA-directed RNA polymerase specialized sigma24 family protein